MSIRFIGAVWDSGLYDGPRLLMMLALADHADDDGWCWPRYETLALKIRRNAKTVYRVLADLEEHGAIRREGERIVISEPAIVEEAGRRAGARSAEKRPRKILNNEKEILNNENGILKSENDFLNSENDFLKNEKPFFIEPSINRQLPPAPPKPEEVEVVLDDPVLALAEHFATKAGIVAGVPDVHASMYQDYWKPTLSAILNRVGGDEEMARAVVDASIAFCWGKGTNTSGKTYPLSNPHSIRNIYINRASELSAHAVTAEDETLWQRAIQAITRRDYSDERLKAAIRAIGGSDRIATANGKDTDQLRRNLGYEYRRISAPV